MTLDFNTPTFSSRRQRDLFLAALFVAFVIVFLFLSGFKSTYIDDAFIQLTYARNLAEHGTWGMFPDRLANTATSPLNVLLTAAFGLILRDWLNVVIWLTTFQYVAILAFLLLLSQRLFRHYYAGVFAFLGFLTNPLLLSTLGMESILYTLFIVMALYFFVRGNWVALAVILGLLTLTRPEGVLLFAIFLLVVPMPVRQRWKFILVYGVTMLPWYGYAWVQLGSIFPDTMIIKTGQGSWGDGISFHNGLGLYLRNYPLATITSFFLLPLGIFAFWRSERTVKMVTAVTVAYGCLHFAAYWVLRVPPYHWYYTHQVIAAVLVGALGIGSLVQNGSLLRGTGRPLAYVLLLLPAAGLIGEASRYGYPLAEAPIHTNWATQAQYEDLGQWLQTELDADTVIQITMELGTVAYYADRHLVNEFSDLNIISRTIENSNYVRIPVAGQILQLNYLWRDRQDPIYPTYILEHGPVAEIDLARDDLVMTWPATSKWAPADQEYIMFLRQAPPDYWKDEPQ